MRLSDVGESVEAQAKGGHGGGRNKLSRGKFHHKFFTCNFAEQSPTLLSMLGEGFHSLRTPVLASNDEGVLLLNQMYGFHSLLL